MCSRQTLPQKHTGQKIRHFAARPGTGTNATWERVLDGERVPCTPVGISAGLQTLLETTTAEAHADIVRALDMNTDVYALPRLLTGDGRKRTMFVRYAIRAAFGMDIIDMTTSRNQKASTYGTKIIICNLPHLRDAYGIGWLQRETVLNEPPDDLLGDACEPVPAPTAFQHAV